MDPTIAGEESVRFFNAHKQDKDWNNKIKDLEDLRQKFVRRFRASDIGKLTKETYSIGKGKNTFCYAIENEYKDLGVIHGATAKKFGIYYGCLGDDKNIEFRIGKSAFGSNVDSAFSKVKEEILKLVNSNAPLSSEEFKANLISPMLKLKVLFIYNPELYLPIYSDKHLAHFATELGLVPKKNDHISLQSCLLTYKASHPFFKNIDNMEFAQILYSTARPPKDQTQAKRILTQLVTSKDLQEVTISSLQSIGLELNDGFGKAKGKSDYSAQDRENRKTGAIGEELVMAFEKEKLLTAGKPSLANKIKHVSKKDDGLGYDIQSFTALGEKIFIEVKTSQSSFAKSRYFISRNEWEVGKTLHSYWLYIIGDLNSKKPKILRLENPFNSRSLKVTLEPVQYLLMCKPS